MPDDTIDPHLARVTAICLALPEATCERNGGHATFRVRGKTFAYFLDDHHGDGKVAITVATARGENADWVASDPVRFYLPAYLGARGWVALRLDTGPVDWPLVHTLVVDSYRRGAPKTLARQVAPTDGS